MMVRNVCSDVEIYTLQLIVERHGWMFGTADMSVGIAIKLLRDELINNEEIDHSYPSCPMCLYDKLRELEGEKDGQQ